MNTLDFQRGNDFTGINPAQGSDLNNLMDLSGPSQSGQGDVNQGVGFIIVTTDTALGVPNVPNPQTSASYNKWARYMWVRRPVVGAPDKRCTRYSWNPDAPLDATLLYWVIDFTDNSALINSINNATATANNAQVTAQSANSTAATALNTANTANTGVATAQTTANTAQATANTAQNTANAAQTAANNVNTVVNAPNAQAILSPPGVPYVKPFVGGNNNTVTWLADYQWFAQFSERQAKGTDAGAASIGKNTRGLNTVDYYSSTIGFAIFNAGNNTVSLIPGQYHIRAKAPVYSTGTQAHQLVLANNANSASLMYGSSCVDASGGTSWSEIDGILSVPVGGILTVRLDHYVSANVATNGLGKAANVNPDVGGQEVYSTLFVEFIG